MGDPLLKRFLLSLVLLPYVLPLHAELVLGDDVAYECVRPDGTVVAEEACQEGDRGSLSGKWRITLSAEAEAQIVRGIQRRSQRPEPPPPPETDDVVLLGDNAVGSGSESGGVYTLTARGTNDPDNGTFWPLQTFASGNAQIIWRINTALTGTTVGDFSGAGAQFRSGVAGAEKMLLSWHVNQGNRCRFKYRTAEDGSVTGGILGNSNVTIPYYCAMTYDAAFPRAQFWESDDAISWVLVDTVSITMDYPFDAGLYCVGWQSNAVTVTCVLDNVDVSDTITITDSIPPDDPDDPTAPPNDPVNDIYGTGFDETANTGWRTTADTVTGWDWSFPPGTSVATGSGVFNLNSSIPSHFTGNHLRQCNVQWKGLEPTENNYDLSDITDCLNDTDYDGIMLNVRTYVVEIDDCNGNDAHTGEWSAPSWLQTPTVQESCKHNSFRINNLKISDSGVHSRVLDLIDHISTATPAALGGSTTIPEHPKLIAQILHGVSNSRGEEWTGTQSSTSAAETAQAAVIQAWIDGYGVNAKKLAWIKENPIELYNASVGQGTGIRGGAIESWLRQQYTGGSAGGIDTSTLVGQSYDDGYLSVIESNVSISEGRHFQDQNEAYRTEKFPDKTAWHRNYRAANLRLLQMRRNIAWLVTNSSIDPRMDSWMGVSLGKSATTSSDAFVWLMRSWTYWGGSAKEVKNLERWLYQRETQGATTPASSCCRLDNGQNIASHNSLATNLWYHDAARLGSSIGIAVDDDFLFGAHSVVMKVTYLDIGTGNITVTYDDDGTGGSLSVARQGSGDVRTSSFFLTDFNADESGFIKDFSIDSNGTAPIIMVRIIKCGGSFPACT